MNLAETASSADLGCSSNYSNENLEEVLKTNKEDVCGLKVFMGSSTGNMLVDKEATLNGIFSQVDMLIATHCEDESTIRARTKRYQEKYGPDMPIKYHPEIRKGIKCYAIR